MAIDKTKLTGVEKVYPLNVSPYEQYMGDFQNPSVVSKINAMIQSLHQIGRLTNETVSQWNNVMKWIVEGGMDEIAETVTNEKVSVALEEVMRMLDVSLDNGLKELAETTTENQISELIETGEFSGMVIESVAKMNQIVENKLDGFNLRLAESAKETDLEIERQRISNLIQLPVGSTTNDARLEDIRIGANGVTYESPADSVRKQITNVDSKISSFRNDVAVLVKSKNLLNTNDVGFLTGKYINSTTGIITDNESYITSGFIPVSNYEKIVRTVKSPVSGNRLATAIRSIACYNDLFTLMPSVGSTVDVVDFIKPQGVAYIRISYLNRVDMVDNMIHGTTLDDNSLPLFENYFTPYYKTLIDTDTTLSKESVPADSKAVGEALSKLNEKNTLYKNPSIVKRKNELSGNVPIDIPEFPEMLKAGQRISYSANVLSFSTIDTIKVGFISPTNSSYQSWLEITATHVKWMLSGTNAILNEAHGLTISDFVNLSLNINPENAKLEIVLTTSTGTFSFKQIIDSTRFNAIGVLKANATMATKNVVLSGTCTQFKYDTWMIGDSYFGSGDTRIGGRLLEWNYAGGVLISGVGGLNSQRGYEELNKLLTFGTPKTIVWYLGMNDNETTVNTYFPLVEQLCDENGIELVFNRIPLVPTRLIHNKAVNTYVLASGRRYIDSYSAVGADDNGNWYAGHLNSDGVHPDPLGAASLTSRMLVEVPEILSASIT